MTRPWFQDEAVGVHDRRSGSKHACGHCGTPVLGTQDTLSTARVVEWHGPGARHLFYCRASCYQRRHDNITATYDGALPWQPVAGIGNINEGTQYDSQEQER